VDAVLVPMKVPAARLADFVPRGFDGQSVCGIWVALSKAQWLTRLTRHAD